MKREERIYSFLKDLSLKEMENNHNPLGFEAQEVASLMKLDRGNVSKDLNNLAKKGLIVKFEGRPVRFLDHEVYDNYLAMKEKSIDSTYSRRYGSTAFDNIIGQEGSLKVQIKQAKAAVLYPPYGLHTLLTGSTGTGKTTFAKEMYKYAVDMHIIEKNSKFVVFNCAEYADNPQLIVSQLFGHQKGAFSGADNDKAGLIEQADRGILFLDEIHRLPPEGQEMLFSLMDYGMYRRLGETERTRNARVLILGATTENLETALLKTFLRRMPVVIQLPSLKERPIIERLQLIEKFLCSEIEKMEVSVTVLKEVILSLLLYDCSGNVGQLKADIQLLCARSFWEYKTGDKSVMELNKNLLPVYLEKVLYQGKEYNHALISFIKNGEDKYTFPYYGGNNDNDYDSKGIENVITKKYYIYNKFYSSHNDEDDTMDRYVSNLIGLNNDKKSFNKDNLNKVITGKVYYAVEEAIEFAEMKLGIKMSDNIKIGFALHINALVDGIEKRNPISEEKLKEIIQSHSQEAKVSKLILRILEEELDISFNEEEVGYVILFLSASTDEQKFKKIGVIVVAHGRSTATSMADAANKLLDVNHCRGIDMGINDSVDEVYKKVVQATREADEGKGVLILVDMGSLKMFAERITEETGIKVASVGMVSTLMVVEAVRKCTDKNAELLEVSQYIKKIGIHMLEEKQEYIKAQQKETVILINCMSGMGAAVKISEMVQAITGIKDEDNIKLCDVGYEGRDSKGVLYGGYDKESIIAVVGTVDLHIENVPFISIDNLVMGQGIESLENIIQGNKQLIPNKRIKSSSVDREVLIYTLKEILEFLDVEKIVPMIITSFKACALRLNLSNPKDLIIRYVIHIACMIERIIKGELLPYKDIDDFKIKNEVAFKVASEEIVPIENTFRIKVTDEEIAYIVKILSVSNVDNT